MENRRKNYFISKEFQAKFILKFCTLVLLTAVISAVLIYLFLSRSVTTVFEDSKITMKPSTEFIIPGLILSTLASVALVSLATIITVLFISHRIAGPLYKLESSLGRMGGGDLSFDIYFRSNDEAKALSDAFNSARRQLSGIISAIQKEHIRLADEIDQMKKASDKLPAELRDIKKNINSLEGSSSNINEKISKFKL